MFVKNIAKGLKSAFNSFPLSMISSILLTAILIYMVDIHKPKEFLIKIFLTLTVGVILFVLSSFFSKKYPKSAILANTVAVILLVLYYIFGLENIDSYFVAERHFIILLALFVAIFWFNFKNDSNEILWQYTKESVITSFLGAFVTTLIMIAGIDLAILAIDKLFNIDIDGKIYAKVNIFIAGVLGVGYFLSQLSISRDKVEVSRLEEYFTKYMLTTLTILYALILYAYSAKILINMSLPSGVVVWIVSLFSFIAIVTYLFWIHFEKKELYHKLIWLLILPQAIIMLIALKVRVEQYSWTENRYYIALFGVWLIAMAIYFLFVKRAKIKYLFMSFSIILLLTLYGPLSATNIAYKAQSNKLKELLSEYNKQKSSSIKSTDIDYNLRYSISNTIDFINKRAGKKGLKEFFPKIIKEYEDSKSHKPLSAYITEKLGFEHLNYWEYENQKKEHKITQFYGNKNIEVLNIKDYDYLVESNFYSHHHRELNTSSVKINYDGKKINISIGGKFIIIKFDEIFKKLQDKNKKSVLNQEEMTFEFDNNLIKVKLFLNEISKVGDSFNVRVQMLIKEK